MTNATYSTYRNKVMFSFEKANGLKLQQSLVQGILEFS